MSAETGVEAFKESVRLVMNSRKITAEEYYAELLQEDPQTKFILQRLAHAYDMTIAQILFSAYELAKPPGSEVTDYPQGIGQMK